MFKLRKLQYKKKIFINAGTNILSLVIKTNKAKHPIATVGTKYSRA